MPLVNGKEMLAKAYKENYAVGAFNMNNMESLQAITEAAAETRSPVIIQVSQGARKYANGVYLVKMLEAALTNTDIPICLHLDHGADFEQCRAAIDSGFSSVMIDASAYSLEENIKITKEVVKYAHDRNITVEAELGKLAGIEDDVNVKESDASYTNPDDVYEFVSRTGCDSLAIAIGTSHGAFKFKGEPRLRFDILERIQQMLPDFPIVLHGASSVPQAEIAVINKYGGDMKNAQGVPEDMLRKAASMAVCKINIDSDLRVVATAAVRKTLFENPSYFDPRQFLGPARLAMKELVKHKIINVLGSNGKA